MKQVIRLLAVALIPAFNPLLSWAGPVNINTADAPTLARELDGIGLAKAEAIVADRKLNGLFRSAADLARVKGVGERIVAMNKSNIRLADPSK